MSEVEAALAAIWEAEGRLTPGLVVAAASDPGHVLHSRFEWDDRVAGRAHRLEQARGLIRSVTVDFTPRGEVEPRRVRAFVSCRVDGEPDAGYTPVRVAVADPERGRVVLERLLAQVRALQRAYGHLEEFRRVVADELGLGDGS